MIIGAGSCVFYAHGSYFYEGVAGLLFNIAAVMLLIVADLLDCTDGQLARMTGKKSRLGRILDGAAGFVWFLPIYLSLVYRFYFHHSIEFGWLGLSDTNENVLIATAIVLVLSLYSGFAGMAGQQRLADYYIQVHLFFLKGEKGSELDNSAAQQAIYDQMPEDAPWYERFFQKSYIGYTQKQEQATPEFQHLMKCIKAKYGDIEAMPADLREEFHRESLSLMKWNGLLTFNFRSSFFFLFCLLDIPVMNFLFEVIAMALLTSYINHRHESLSRRLARIIEN